MNQTPAPVDPTELQRAAAGRPADRPLTERVKTIVLGAPRDLHDRSLFHRLALIPFLAWVGIGADGLSSSCYGPEVAFRSLGQHTFLALGLVALTSITIFVIATAYSKIIEKFPQGAGGYVVASTLLGERAGLVSGSALLVDYVLTITTSVAAAGNTIFSLLPLSWQSHKLGCEIAFVLVLTLLNLRGIRASVLALRLTPIFLLFLATHAVLIAGGVITHAADAAPAIQRVTEGYQNGMSTLGFGGLLLLFLHAYSLGGGTYTGIEAVSNGLATMREPRVKTAKRTMWYMATSLAITASGLLLCYLLFDIRAEPGKTFNATLLERFATFPGGSLFVAVALLSAGALLLTAAQAGFLDGPRVLASMAVDSWVPRRLSALSDRLVTRNGIALMGAASLIALIYTKGEVEHLVVMYSINVFITFSLSMFGMLLFWFQARKTKRHWKRRAIIFFTGFVLCATILVVTVIEKFAEGGWVTLAVTGGFVLLCLTIQRHYRAVRAKLGKLYDDLADLTPNPNPAPPPEVDPASRTAVVLVSGFGGLGLHTVLALLRTWPRHYRNLVFVSIGVIDSGGFKGGHALESLQARTESMLKKYVDLAHRLGLAATARVGIGTDAVHEAIEVCRKVNTEFPHACFFAGKVIFRKEAWYQRVLHNETALSVQKRLQLAGITMVVLPARVW